MTLLSEHIERLEEIIRKSGELLEGNCFYAHCTLTKHPDLKNKQYNLALLGKGRKNIAEIGLNAGHSALLFLYDNPTIETLTIFDICDHAYTKPCYEYLRLTFPHVTFRLIEGNTLHTLPKHATEDNYRYDLIHMDGGHFGPVVENDLYYCTLFSDTVIVDDTNFPHINQCVERCIKGKGQWQELKLLPTPMYPHRVLVR